MDPKKMFSDERFLKVCVYCGAYGDTRDHVPSKVLLDEPYPPNLPIVPSCYKCNNGFSVDEVYLACFIEVVTHGTTIIQNLKREKIQRILSSKPDLIQLINSTQKIDDGKLVWTPDYKRISNVIMKLCRGHVAYEYSEPQLDSPLYCSITPLVCMDIEEINAFESIPDESIWPEIGSRAFLRACGFGGDAFLDNGWQVIQPGRYRYLVSCSGAITVKIVLDEYLACEVSWN